MEIFDTTLWPFPLTVCNLRYATQKIHPKHGRDRPWAVTGGKAQFCHFPAVDEQPAEMEGIQFT